MNLFLILILLCSQEVAAFHHSRSRFRFIIPTHIKPIARNQDTFIIYAKSKYMQIRTLTPIEKVQHFFKTFRIFISNKFRPLTNRIQKIYRAYAGHTIYVLKF